MTFYIDEYIQAFKQGLLNCNTKDDYLDLLKKVELMCIEHLNTLSEDEYSSFYDESPLLAMIAEINLVCPESVSELAKENIIFSTAQEMLSDYSKDELAYLRRHYLKIENSNVIKVNFKAKKKKTD